MALGSGIEPTRRLFGKNRKRLELTQSQKKIKKREGKRMPSLHFSPGATILLTLHRTTRKLWLGNSPNICLLEPRSTG